MTSLSNIFIMFDSPRIILEPLADLILIRKQRRKCMMLFPFYKQETWGFGRCSPTHLALTWLPDGSSGKEAAK